MSPYLLSRKVLFLLLLWLLFTSGICQDSTYLVRQGIHPVKVIPLTERYQYPNFRSGFLYFSTGKISDEFLLNYNLFAQQIQLIDSRGDTVALDNKLSIVEFIQIESDFYFRDLREGYFLLLTSEEPLKLTKRTEWNEMVFPNGESTFQKKHEYFFLAPSPNRVLRAYKSSLTKIFPNNKQAIKDYLSQHNIDFTKESDLRQVIAYCNGLAGREDH